MRSLPAAGDLGEGDVAAEADDTELLAGGSRAGGDVLAGRYRLMSCIGVGGTADVWRAHDERHGRTVTLKILRAREDPIIRRAFLAEAEILDSLTHAGIIPVLGIHDTLGVTAIVFAHVDGESLATVAGRRRFSGREVAAILVQLAGALASLHHRGFVHLDLKPANILFSSDGRVRLLDFGIAEPIGHAPQPLRGTPRYVAPEVRAGGPATPASDVYGLATVARELLAGTASGARASAVLARALSADPSDRYPRTRSFATAFACAVFVDDELAAAGAGIRRLVRRVALLGRTIGRAVDRRPRVRLTATRPRALLGSLVAVLWVSSVTLAPMGGIAAREPLAPGSLVAAAFELPPLRAYGARFERQGPYPTATAPGQIEWVVALRNTGSAGWHRGIAGAQASLVFDDGRQAAVQTTSYVGPGQVGWFIARLAVPAETGTYVVALHPRIDGRGRLEELGIHALVTVSKTRGAPAGRR